MIKTKGVILESNTFCRTPFIRPEAAKKLAFPLAAHFERNKVPAISGRGH